MANYHLQAPHMNGGKGEGSNPGVQYPPYNPWPPQQYPGYNSHPWYPPYQNQFPQQEKAPPIKQELGQPPHVKQEVPSTTEDYTQEPSHQSASHVPPQQGTSQYPLPQQEASQQGLPPYPSQEGPPKQADSKHSLQQGHPQYPPPQGHPQFAPYFPSFPPQGFNPVGSWNPYNYNPMPPWNGRPGQYYHPGWQQFQQGQQPHQSGQQPPQSAHQNNQQMVENEPLNSADNSVDIKPEAFEHNTTSELDNSSERTSDLGSSLNNSSGGESDSPERMVLPVKMPPPRMPKYTDWEEDELTLMPGWKKRSYHHGIIKKKTLYQYLSPTQEIFDTRGQMVEHLKLEGHSEEDVTRVASGVRRGPRVPFNEENVPPALSGSRRSVSRDPRFMHNDWVTDESLPSGWLKRSTEWKASHTRTAFKFTYLAPDNRIFNSRNEIISFMRDSDQYSQEDVDKVLSGKGNRKRPNEFIPDSNVNATDNMERPLKQSRLSELNKDESSDEEKEEPEKPVVKKMNQFTDWSVDTTLPEGWKVRSKEVEEDGKVSTVHQFLSPDRKVLSSRAEVDEYLKTLDGYKEDIKTKLSEINENDKSQLNDLQGKDITRAINNEDALKNVNEHALKNVYQHNLNVQDKTARLPMKTYSNMKVPNAPKPVNGNVPNRSSSNVQKLVIGNAQNVSTLNVSRPDNGNVSKPANGNVPRPSNGIVQNLSALNVQRLGNLNVPNLPKGIDLIPMKNMQSINVHENRVPGRILTNSGNAGPSNPGRMLPNLVKEGLPNQADWENDESLPNGWKRRSFMRKWMTRGEMKSAEQHQYLCIYPTRQIFSSRAQVVEYMQRSNYPEHEIRRVRDGKKSVTQKPYLNSLLDNNGMINNINKSITITPVSEKPINKNITITKVGETPGIPQLNSNITVTKVNISPQKSMYQKTRQGAQGNGNWETDDEILPQGWKRRSFVNAGAIKINQYLGPNHQLFSSSEEVFKFMKNSEHYSLEDAVKFLSGIRKREEAFKNPTVITKKTEITKTNITNYIPIEPIKRNSNHSVFNGKFNNIPFPKNIIAEPIKKEQNNISLEAIKENFSAISVEKAITNATVNLAAIVEKSNKSIITVDVDADDESTEEKEVPKLNIKQNDLERNFEESYLMRKTPAPEEDDGIEHIETVTKHDWAVDKSLPEGWKRRPLIGRSSQRKRDGSMVVTKYQYLSPEHDIFNSRKEIMSYMESYTNMPNQEQIQKLFLDYDKENTHENDYLQLEDRDKQIIRINESNKTDVLLVNSREDHEEIYSQDNPKENMVNESENVKVLSNEENCAKYPSEATISEVSVSVDQVEKGEREALNDDKKYEVATYKIENSDNVAIEMVDQQDELKIDNEENKYISMDMDEGSAEQIKNAEFIINLDEKIEIAGISDTFNIDMKNEQDLLLQVNREHLKDNIDEHKEESKLGLADDVLKYDVGLGTHILSVNESMDQEEATEVQNYAIYEEVINEDENNYAIYEEVIKEDHSIHNDDYEKEVDERVIMYANKHEPALNKLEGAKEDTIYKDENDITMDNENDITMDNENKYEDPVDYARNTSDFNEGELYDVFKDAKAGNNASEYKCSDDTEQRGTEPPNNDILPSEQEKEIIHDQNESVAQIVLNKGVNDGNDEENMVTNDTVSYEEVNIESDIMESNEFELESSLIEGKNDKSIESILIESNPVENMKTDNIGLSNDVLIAEVSGKQEKEMIHNQNDSLTQIVQNKRIDYRNEEKNMETDGIKSCQEMDIESDVIDSNHKESKESDSIEMNQEANIESNSTISSNKDQNMKLDLDESTQKESEQNIAPIKFMEDSIGPRIIIQRSNFEMLSQMFATHPNPSKSVMEDICDDTEMSAKDVKWTFIKLRHKFDHKKGEQVDKEAVGKMIQTVRSRFSKDALLEL